MNTLCFAAKESGCAALVGASCEGCRFCKSARRHERDRQAAMQRIYELPEYSRTEIAKTYYRGKLP